MARNSPRRHGPRAFRDINLAPLVDVMLVLLFVFMVTAPLLTSGLPVELPRVSAEPTPIADSRLVVSVTADERVFFDQRDVTDDLQRAFAEDEQLSRAEAIYVRADENARYGAVASVVAAVRSVGVAEVNLVVAQEP